MVKLLREEGEPRKIHTRIRSFDGGLIRIRYLPANLGLHQNITDDEKRVPQRLYLRTSLKGIVVEIFGEK